MPQTTAPTQSIISAQRVCHAYMRSDESAVQALKDVTLDIRRGEFVAILGHNGSGKSTLAKHFNALLQPSEGVLYVDGMDIKDEQLIWEVHQVAGMVFQNPDNQIIATVVEEDVAFGPENLGISSAQIRMRVDDALQTVGMTEYAEKAPHMLSGGQKQRVAIAGVLAMQPKLIIFDEATAMLDPVGREDVMAAVHQLNRDMGITIILITHFMEEAVQADRVVAMKAGQVVLFDTPQQVFLNVDILKDCGLDVPQMVLLRKVLATQNVVQLSHSILTVQAMAQALTPLLLSCPECTWTSQARKVPAPCGDQPAIVIRDLNYTYMTGTPYETHALVDINLTIDRGEIFGLIGHTGSGKSTLIQHFNGILAPTSGSVVVEGMDVHAKNIDRKRLVSTVGLVFQYPEYQLFEETVKKDIAFGPRNLGWEEAAIDEAVEHAAALVGVDLEQRGNDSPFELSGGERRRVALAGVLAMQPQVLILDEPMAGLDPRGRKDILRLIRDIQRERGCTIVVVSHSMDDMAELAERIAVMKDGAIAMLGTPQEVFADGEKLESMGMELPQILQLCQALRKNGVCLPAEVQHMDDFVKYVQQRVGKV